MVSNISAEMLLSFINYHGKKKVSMEEMFKNLSLEMGGDGSKITKSQLDAYIKKAESGSIKISKAKLKALKKLQANWDQISKGKDSVTYSDLKDFPVLLANAVIGDFEDPDKEDKKDKSDNSDEYKLNINDYLKKAFDISDANEITKSELESHLQSLLADSSNDEANSDLVDLFTNLIASYQPNTTVETDV